MIEAAETGISQRVLMPLLIFGGALLIGLVLETLLWGLSKLARRTFWRGDNAVLQALRGMWLFWGALAGAAGALLITPFADTFWQSLLLQGIYIAFVVSLTLLCMRLAAGLLTVYSEQGDLPAVSVVRGSIRFFIGALGFVFVLQGFGVPVTPLLTAIGASSLGLTLALQDTISSVFSGILIALSDYVRPGDYVRLESGEEGYVRDINWRTTQIERLGNSMLIVPNSVMTGSTVINFDKPSRPLSVLVNLGVAYDSDLERVEQLTIEVARRVVHEVQGGDTDVEPFIRYNDFGEFRINFTVILRGIEYVDQYRLKHEFVKRLHKCFRAEGIEIPLPSRLIYNRDGTRVGLPEGGDVPAQQPDSPALHAYPDPAARSTGGAE